MRLHFIGAGKLIYSIYAESLMGKLRVECVSGNWFLSLPNTRNTVEACRTDYNGARPHSPRFGSTPGQEDYDRTPIETGIFYYNARVEDVYEQRINRNGY